MDATGPAMSGLSIPGGLHPKWGALLLPQLIPERHERRLLGETPRLAGLEAFAAGRGEGFAIEACACGNFEFGFGQRRCVGHRESVEQMPADELARNSADAGQIASLGVKHFGRHRFGRGLRSEDEDATRVPGCAWPCFGSTALLP